MKAPLDSIVNEINKRRDECDHRLSVLGSELAEYFSLHLKHKRKYTSDESISMLQDFFTRQGTYLGIDKLEEHYSEIRSSESDYYIAQYIFEKKEVDAPEYSYIIDLVKGYFLQSALYLQGNNGSVTTATYRNVAFYCIAGTNKPPAMQVCSEIALASRKKPPEV